MSNDSIDRESPSGASAFPRVHYITFTDGSTYSRARLQQECDVEGAAGCWSNGIEEDGTDKRQGRLERGFFVFNVLLAGIALILTALSGFTRGVPQGIILSQPLVKGAISGGALILVTAVIGCIAGKLYKSSIFIPSRTKLAKCFIVVYYAFAIILIAVLFWIGSTFMTQESTFREAMSNPTMPQSSDFENNLRSLFVISHPRQWKDVQQLYKCCGYNCTLPLSVMCGSTPCCPLDGVTWNTCIKAYNQSTLSNYTATYQPCRRSLLSYARERSSTIGTCALILACATLFFLILIVAQGTCGCAASVWQFLKAGHYGFEGPALHRGVRVPIGSTHDLTQETSDDLQTTQQHS